MQLIGHNEDLSTQVEMLQSVLQKNTVLFDVINRAQLLNIENYFIGAGCICQSVWNYQNGYEPMYGISDIDFVYFDDNDLSFEAEDIVVNRIKVLFSDVDISVDVKNQARVHLWYEQFFGYKLKPYTSVESAINTWPTTATSIGVRLTDNVLNIYAPFGLNDMFGQIIRANKTQITKETYDNKCEKWRSKWETLKVIEW